MSEHSRKRPKSAQGQKAGAQNTDPAAAEPVSAKPGASASHPQAGSLPGAERSPFRTMKSPVVKGPGSKGPGSKGPGSKGPGTKGPSAKGLGVDVPGVNVPGSKSPMFSVTSHGAASDKAAWSTVAACGTLAILSPSLMSPGSAGSPKALIQEPAVDIPENMRFPPLLVLSPEEQARRDERWRRRTRLNLVFFVLASVGGLAVLAALWMWLPQLVLVIWPPTSNAPMGNFSRWAVVTIKECAGVPRRVFAQSGTIGDAAVALTLCTCVALPIHCGLGGGVMALYYNNASRKTWFIDGREESPSGASKSFYATSSTTESGVMSIAVPGQIRGLVKLHELTGNNLAWKQLFTEAIELAKEGFLVSQRMIDDLELYRNDIERDRRLRVLFKLDQLKVGAAFKQIEMAKTLTKLASAARQDYFYQKEFATEWHKELAAIGSLIKLPDILNYEARRLPTLNITLDDDLMLVTSPPPTTGAITAAICGIVKQKYSNNPPIDDASFYHVLTEAFKFGFGRRSLFGDYNFTDPEVLLRNLMFSRSPKDAIDWYRIHHQLMPNTLFVEDRMDMGQQAYLRFRSHDVKSLQHWTGTVVAMTREAGRIYATYDFRDNSLSNTIVGE